MIESLPRPDNTESNRQTDALTQFWGEPMTAEELEEFKRVAKEMEEKEAEDNHEVSRRAYIPIGRSAIFRAYRR